MHQAAFNALADQNRRRIVTLLGGNELPVAEIRKEFPISAPAISQHLSVLKSAGLVRSRTDGRRRLYRLNPKRLNEIQAWLAEPASLSRSTKTLPTLVDATTLEQWAQRQDAPGLLPLLARNLIVATTSSLTLIDFRAGEGVVLGGVDGTVVATEANAWVPRGKSIWELSTEQRPRQKAQADYDKRTTEFSALQRQESAFIFLTPRRWPGKATWAAEKRDREDWRDVRAYDADDLETWLETAPAVHVWASLRLGMTIDGIEDLESAWLDWSHATDPAISLDFLLAGRDEVAEKIATWLTSGSEPTMSIKAESQDESVAVCAASVLRLSEEKRAPILSRTVVVNSVTAFNTIALSAKPLILIARFVDEAAVTRACRRGHRVIVALGAQDAGANSLTVPRIGRQAGQLALKGMGIKDADLIESAAHARRSMLSFRRAIAIRPELRQPAWASAASTRPLLAAFFAGAWNDTSDADRRVIEELSQMKYSDFIESLNPLIHSADPPLHRIGDVWRVVSREDMWSHLAPRLRKDDAERIHEQAFQVLGELDPRLTLPAEDRWLAGIKGKLRRYSSELSAGIADGLALMGARGEEIHLGSHATVSDYVRSTVRRLLHHANQDGLVWQSAGRFLPRLAEAAPDEFMAAIDGGLSGERPVVMNLFIEESGPLSASSEHTGLLWALETIAWSPQHLTHAALILAKLARLDPGGKLGNRPEATLRGIFLPWYPQTAASVEQRLIALDRMREQEPEAAWTLLAQLLPEFHSVGHPTAKPHWREWAPEGDPKVTHRELYTAYVGVIERMLADAGSSGVRWSILIKAYRELAQPERDALLAKLRSLASASIDSADAVSIWDALRDFLSHHRSFPDAEWALPAEQVATLAELLPAFEPGDIATRAAWLFNNSAPNLPEGNSHDYYEQEKIISTRRSEALAEIYARGGLEGLLSFAQAVAEPHWVGAEMGRHDFVNGEIGDLVIQHLGSDISTLSSVAHAFVVGRVGTRGMPWAVEKYRAFSGSDHQRAAFLRAFPELDWKWDLLEESGDEVAAIFWRSFRPWGVQPHDTEYVVRNLLRHGRPYSAINLLAMKVRMEPTLPRALIVEALQQAAHTDPRTDARIEAFHITELFDRLSGDAGDADVIARLEWQFLPVLRHNRSPRFLNAELQRNPKFFIELVTLAYRAEGESPRDLTEDDRARALRAHELLDSWHTIPGGGTANSINYEVLNAWIAETRSLAAEIGRAKVTDSLIGRMLSHSPVGADDAWPTEPVREIVEKLASEPLENGVEVGKFNSRGVVMRNPSDGGGQERQLAKMYTQHSVKMESKWPRTAAMLRRIADKYQHDARREDDHSELMEMLDA